MVKTIIDMIEKGLSAICKDEVDDIFIKRVFRLRYASGMRALSKFSYISTSVGRSGQTVRISVLNAWRTMPNIDEIVNEASQTISKHMEVSQKTSISSSDLAGKGVFDGMTADDIITLMHDMISYCSSEFNMPIFIVRKHGVSTLSLVGKVDQLDREEIGAFKPVSLPPKAFSAVHLAKTIGNGEGSLYDDVISLAGAISPNGSKILADRIGLKDNAYSTLSQVGKQYGVTRERIRQVTINLIRQMMSVEFVSECGPITTLKAICENTDFSENNVVSIADLIKNNAYLSGFNSNEKGLFILLSAVGIQNIIQSSGFYLHKPDISKDHGIYEISEVKAARASNKRRSKTSDHQQMMAVLPLALIEKVKVVAAKNNLSANMLYINLLEDFMKNAPSKIEGNCAVDWARVGREWRMVNMRFAVKMITKVNDLAEKMKVSRASLVYHVVKNNLN